jgi:UDP-N-acetylenolpyruvoylglucosamine reductase
MIVNKNASLKKLNTFNVDASCDVLVESSNTNDLLEVLKNKELITNYLFLEAEVIYYLQSIMKELLLI